MIKEKQAVKIKNCFNTLKYGRRNHGYKRVSAKKSRNLSKGIKLLCLVSHHSDFLRKHYGNTFHTAHGRKRKNTASRIIHQHSYIYWQRIAKKLFKNVPASLQEIDNLADKYYRRRQMHRKAVRIRRRKKYHGFNSRAELNNAAILAYMKGDPTYAVKLGLVSKRRVKQEQRAEHEKERIIEYRKSHRRTRLAKLGNKLRHQFIGTFVRSGFKTTFHGNGLRTGDCYVPTLLLRNILLINDNKLVTNHLWLNYTKGFRKIGQLKPGDKVTFNARVSTYYKGYGPVEDKTLDYSLSFPTKIKRVNDDNRHALPINNKNALIGYIMMQNKKFYLANDRPYDDWYVSQYQKWLKLNNNK